MRLALEIVEQRKPGPIRWVITMDGRHAGPPLTWAHGLVVFRWLARVIGLVEAVGKGADLGTAPADYLSRQCEECGGTGWMQTCGPAMRCIYCDAKKHRWVEARLIIPRSQARYKVCVQCGVKLSGKTLYDDCPK